MRDDRLKWWSKALKASVLTVFLTGSVGVALDDVFIDEEEEDDSVGFELKQLEPEVQDLLEDFARYRKRSDWTKAFRSIDKIFKKTPDGLIRAEKGFYVPWKDRVREMLIDLPRDGREAYQIMSDASARNLMDKLNPENELDTLQHIYSQFFITSEGDQAGDRLADLYFELGDFTKAEQLWKEILETYPDTDLSIPRLQLKRGIALARDRQWKDFATLLETVGEKYDKTPIRIGGQDVVLSAYLKALQQALETPDAPSGAVTSMASLSLPESNDPVWQFPLMDEMVERNIEAQSRSYQYIYRSMMVPQTVVNQGKLYINWFGNCQALDMKTGKLLWRTQKSADMIKQNQYYFMQNLWSGTYSIMTDGERLIVLGYPDKNQNYQRNFGVAALDPKDGKVIWNSRERDDLKNWRFLGKPIMKNGVLYAVAQYNQDLNLYALAPADGTVLWQLSLGLMEAANHNRYYGNGGKVAPNPTLIYEDNRIYILTHYGAMIMVNPGERSVGWAYTYEPPSLKQNYSYSFRHQDNALYTVGRPIFADGAVYFKEAYGQRLYKMDTRNRKPLWNRPVGQSDMIISVDDKNIYLLGKEVMAIDKKARYLKWATKVSALANKMGSLLTDDSIYVFGARGIYELNKESGDVNTIFRGADRKALGGFLLTVGDLLISVSNEAITAYPLKKKS